MKAKKGFSGIESFSLCFSTKKPEVLKLPGNDAGTRLINDLFDSGEEEEARKALRKALDEIARDLGQVLADGGTRGEVGETRGTNVMASFPRGAET